jgi:hypothetical protein
MPTKTVVIPAGVMNAYQDAFLVSGKLPPWRQLVERYKDDRNVCNCGEAWYARPTDELHVWDGKYWDFHAKPSHDRVCTYGCQSNQLSCKQEIARRVVEEFLE